MFQAYGNYWKNYFNFKGRSRRAEYWWPTVINAIIGVVLYFLLIGQLMAAYVSGVEVMGSFGQILTIIGLLFGLANIVPGLAVTVRRIHDTGRSGWWWFISCIPVIGSFILLVFLVQPGTQGENQYGADPKAV